MAEKFTRKFLKRPDAFLATLRGGYRWTEDHLKAVAMIAVGIFFISAIWLYANHRMDKKHRTALAAFYRAEKKFDEKFSAVTAAPKKKAAEAQDVAGQVSEELDQIKHVPRDFPKSKGALMSLLKVGDFHASQKQYALALSSYDEALKMAQTHFFKILIFYNRGYMYELSEQYPQAVEQFQKITAINKWRFLFWEFGYRPNPFWLTSAYFGIGRCYEKLSRPTEAKETYLRIADEFPNTPFADKAEALALLIP